VNCGATSVALVVSSSDLPLRGVTAAARRRCFPVWEVVTRQRTGGHFGVRGGQIDRVIKFIPLDAGIRFNRFAGRIPPVCSPVRAPRPGPFIDRRRPGGGGCRCLLLCRENKQTIRQRTPQTGSLFRAPRPGLCINQRRLEQGADVLLSTKKRNSTIREHTAPVAGSL